MMLLEALEGSWEGQGEGHYPTINPFAFGERLTFAGIPGKAISIYQQRSQREDGTPSHSEGGYVRVDGDRVELLIAQPTGYVEIHHGWLQDATVEFGITVLGRTTTALPVVSVRRRWELADERLTTDLWMSYRDVVDGHHLRTTFRRVPEPDLK